MTLLMKSEFAKRHGVGASAVSNWARKGLLVFGEDPMRPGKQLVDAEKSDLLVRGSIDQTRGRPRSAEAALVEAGEAPATAPARAATMTGAEAVRMEEARERIIGRRIDNEKALGNLVSLGEVERRTAERGRMIRERVQATVRNLAERLAAETDPRTITSLLSAELDAVFARLADDIESEASAEAQADVALAGLDEEADEEAEAA
ncbi:hypothetical protein [Brevundimonas vancanneytii]|uniref:Terminase small subunit n=1 Tax=Brevundimonas vancanneytii TaxID=1325724 RepID=A0A4P1JSP3_9CAUL|nr:MULTISPECIES: hypothetical protein [Brevundimonas]VTO10671.1 Uncharacterised protein [Brevundimonas vancanneytii]